MKKTLIALLTLGSIAMADNIKVTNSITFGGSDEANNRLDFDFNGSTNRTVTIITTSSATIGGGTDGYGLGEAGNVLNFDITGTLSIAGTFKGTGTKNGNYGTVNALTTMTDAEVAALIDGGTSSRDLVTHDYLQNLSPAKMAVTLNNPQSLTYGGMLAQVVSGGTTTYYSFDSVTMNGGYWGIADGAQSVELSEGSYYGYVKMLATSGAAPKAIGFVAKGSTAVPEPATGSLSLLALAGLCARRRRK